MPVVAPLPTTLAEIQRTEQLVSSVCRDETLQLCGLFFPTDDDNPHLVTIPYDNGTLSLDYWLFDSERVNYFLSRPRVNLVGIKRHIFKHFPSDVDRLPLQFAYSVYYWTQGRDMLVNRALANTTTNAALHLHVRGDVMVLKHRLCREDTFENMTSEDQALVCAVLDNAVTHGLLDYVVKDEFNVIEIED